MTKSEVAMLLLAAMLLVFFFVAGPLCLIWSINTLFGRENPFDFVHWVAAFVLMVFLRSTAGTNKEAKSSGR